MSDRITYRLKFSKLSRVRFIGHLDLLNVFQRAINRAKLPVAYSQGFNPHQEVSFALPLSLGYHSIGEYMDVIFAKESDTDEIKARLNGVLPEGLEILNVRKLNQGEKNSASVIAAARYEVYLPPITHINKACIKTVLDSDSVEVTKKSKKKESVVNIRPLIYSLKYIEEDKNKILEMFIAAGSAKNLKAELLVQHLCSLSGEPYIAHKTGYKRIDMYSDGEKGFVSLIESGK